MNRLGLVRLVVVFCLVSECASAQQTTSTSGATEPQPSQTVQRDAQAVTTIQNAIVAMGGSAVVSQVQNSVVSGTSVDPASNPSTTVTFTWTYAGAQFRLENDASVGTHIVVSNEGSPQEFHDNNWFSATPVLVRTILAYHVPAVVLLNELDDPNYSLVYVGTTTLNGSPAIHIQTRDNSDSIGMLYTQQDWYFSPTGLPLRVEYQIPVYESASNSLPGSMNFSGFQSVNGMLVPFQLQLKEGPITFKASVTSVALNSSVSTTVFAPSSGGAQ